MTSAPTFSDDRPLTHRDEDRLNRAGFADRIAAVLAALPEGSGIVIGIYGPWGDGKTTVLNLLRANLARNDAMVVRDFNPWRLADDDSIFRGFFSILAEAIGVSLSTTLEQATAGAKWWARRLRWVTKPLGQFSKTAETADGLLASFGEIAQKGDSVRLEQLRNRIVTLLNGTKTRVVILIDDLDRLDKQETHTLFRLIKACADFPNVCYVLAFDDTVVSKAIGERYGGSDEPAGRSFLEKIIQVPLQLPTAAREDLRSLCFARVDRALVAAGIELTKNQVGEFVASFDRGASIRLTTPRAANRFGNGLMFALPSLVGETNPVDHLLVEALRAFFPEAYEVVRDNHADFSGVEENMPGNGSQTPRGVQLLEPVLKTMPQDHADAVKALIIDLFPRLSGAYGHSGYGSDWLSGWSAGQRICAPEYCPRYFTYSVPHDDVADSEVTAILDVARAGEGASLDGRLVSQLHGPKAGRLIEKLRAVEKTVDPMAAETLAVALSKTGKTIPNRHAFFAVAEPPTQAAILISNLLKRINHPASRVAAGRRVLEAAEPLWFGAECLRWMHVSDEPEKDASNTFNSEETAELRFVLVHRIKSRAADGAALFDPDVPQEVALLFEWWRAEGREPVQDHLVRVFTTDPEQITKFLLSQASTLWGSGSATPEVGDLGAEQLKNIDLVIDVSLLADLVRRHCAGNFEKSEWHSDRNRPPEERLAEQFMYVFNKRKRDKAASDSGGQVEVAVSEAESGPDVVDRKP